MTPFPLTSDAGVLPTASADRLASSCFVVTGPTGWIGSAVLAWLARLLSPEAFAHQVTAFGSAERTIQALGRDVHVRPLSAIKPADVDGAFVFHLSFLTRDKIGGVSDADYVTTNLAIDEALCAALESAAPTGLFVASSGAAKQVGLGGSKDFYGLLKLAQEDRFQTFGARTGAPVLIGRIFNISGPFINKPTLYALASFIVQGLEHGKIQIDAPMPVYRSYTHVLDLIAVALGSLDGGFSPPEPIDIAGQEVLEMQDIAEYAAEAIGLPKSRIHRPPLRYDAKSLYLGDPWPFRSLALRCGLRPRRFGEQAADTAAYLRSMRDAARA